MSIETETRPLPELIGGLATDVSTLFRKEIQLAKTEASEKLGQVTAGLVLLGVGGILALGALGVLLTAIVTALAMLFVGMGMDPTGANSLAAVIVAIVVALIAWTFISRGLNGLKASNLMLDKTTHSLGRDAAAIREKI